MRDEAVGNQVVTGARDLVATPDLAEREGDAMTHEIDPDTEHEEWDALPDAATIPTAPLEGVPIGDLNADEELAAMLRHDADGGGR